MKIEQLINLLKAAPSDFEVMIKSFSDDGDHEFINPVYSMKFKPEWVSKSDKYESRPNQVILL